MNPAMQPPAPHSASPPREVRLGDLLVLLGALMVFFFSFAPFVQYSGAMSDGLAADNISSRFNAWSLEIFMVPLTTFVVVAALLGIAAVVARFVLRRDLSALGFRLRQVEVGLALFVFVVLLGMIASDKHAFFGARRLADPDSDPLFLIQSRMAVGWGAVLMLIGAIIALAGAVLNHFSFGPTFAVGAAATPASPPPGAPWQAPPMPPGSPQPGPPPAAPPGPPPSAPPGQPPAAPPPPPTAPPST
jgi:hypothetical protein